MEEGDALMALKGVVEASGLEWRHPMFSEGRAQLGLVWRQGTSRVEDGAGGKLPT